MLATVLQSHTGNGAATRGCTGCGKVAQSLSSEHRGVVIVWRSQIGMTIIEDIRVGSYPSDSRQNIIA
jgi:hypothetical protein